VSAQRGRWLPLVGHLESLFGPAGPWCALSRLTVLRPSAQWVNPRPPPVQRRGRMPPAARPPRRPRAGALAPAGGGASHRAARESPPAGRRGARALGIPVLRSLGLAGHESGDPARTACHHEPLAPDPRGEGGSHGGPQNDRRSGSTTRASWTWRGRSPIGCFARRPNAVVQLLERGCLPRSSGSAANTSAYRSAAAAVSTMAFRRHRG
jgi:hypothetical protein